MNKPTGRMLICIGCDDYDNEALGKLNGAERDAINVFDLLTAENFGNYSNLTSSLLKSPTLAEVIASVEALLGDGQPPDTFTFFFAGHGGVSNGSYYLCLKDTVSRRLATTALSLSQLFQIINERSPLQCNIILDSCQSGGLVGDLSVLLKPELIGAANTSGVSIFASSAADQYSLDTPDGGLGTIYLLRALRGEIPIQTKHPYLDLIEVGKAASEAISQDAHLQATQGPDTTLMPQTPVVWGMNLFGQSRFSKNPNYDSARPSSIHEMTAVSPVSSAGVVIKESAGAIWSLYYADPNSLTTRQVFETLKPIIKDISNEHDVARFINGITTPLRARSNDSNDSFWGVQTTACSIALLLQACPESHVVEASILTLADELVIDLEVTLIALNNDLAARPEYLACEGLSDLFYLPIRVYKILGWAAAVLILKTELGHDVCSAAKLVSDLSTIIIDKYQQCLGLISDEQTPFALTFLYAALKYNMPELGERVLGNITWHFCNDKGNIARVKIDPTRAYEFLARKLENDFTEAYDLLAHPSEALSVILMMAHMYSRVDTVDPYLRCLDHVSHLVFLPSKHNDFAEKVIREGRNHNFQIGHGVWEVSDFIHRWNQTCAHQLIADISLNSKAVRIGSMCSALIFPDRSPWFLLRNETI